MTGVGVIIGTPSGALALTADRLGPVETVVVQALPPFSGAVPFVRGLAVDGRGELVPVLDPSELIGNDILRVPAPGAAPEASARRVLVVDDSITTRMLERSILEAAGLIVETAASGEEALVRASGISYDLFIVDVEMPGLSGFEFLERARETDGLAGVPAILVTSRASAQDRKRGIDAGARAYIVKSEFDQETFLNIVRGLLG
jgi:two-component system chemotaxis sensor kinase CheA